MSLEWNFVEKRCVEGGEWAYMFRRGPLNVAVDDMLECIICSDMSWRQAVLNAYKQLFTLEDLQSLLSTNSSPAELEAYASCACESGSDEELQFWPQLVWNAMLTAIFTVTKRRSFRVIKGGA